MMNNLFSIFDPSTSNNFSLNWLSMFSFMILFPKKYFLQNSRIDWIKNMFLLSVLKDMKSNLKKSFFKNLIFFLCFFSAIALINFSSLFPFIFTPTSHLSISLSFTLPFWFSMMLKGWLQNTYQMLTHLVPSNTPLILCPFMVMIETISNIIRPLTLSIRLSANMIAGHLLISLLSETLNNNIIIFSFTSLVLNTLIVLEMAVAIIQSYVFVTLLSIYLNEIN